MGCTGDDKLYIVAVAITDPVFVFASCSNNIKGEPYNQEGEQ